MNEQIYALSHKVYDTDTEKFSADQKENHFDLWNVYAHIRPAVLHT